MVWLLHKDWRHVLKKLRWRGKRTEIISLMLHSFGVNAIRRQEIDLYWCHQNNIQIYAESLKFIYRISSRVLIYWRVILFLLYRSTDLESLLISLLRNVCLRSCNLENTALSSLTCPWRLVRASSVYGRHHYLLAFNYLLKVIWAMQILCRQFLKRDTVLVICYGLITMLLPEHASVKSPYTAPRSITVAV
jgi:hypothetical protein